MLAAELDVSAAVLDDVDDDDEEDESDLLSLSLSPPQPATVVPISTAANITPAVVDVRASFMWGFLRTS